MKKAILYTLILLTMTLGIAQEKAIPTESGYAPINGMQLYYEAYLPTGQAGGKGKPFILIHGSFMNIPMNWSHIIPLLAKDRKVVVAEMQGHGRTKDISREFSYEGMADDVSGLLKHLKIEKADILGYSMGGGVAFQMAVQIPAGRSTGHHPHRHDATNRLADTYDHRFLGFRPQCRTAYFLGIDKDKNY